MSTQTSNYIEKRFETVLFERCKTVSVNEQPPCYTFVARFNGDIKKVILAILIVPTNMMVKTDRARIYDIPWTQFQVRTYKNEIQAKKATEAFINHLPLPQSLEKNELEEPDVEISQKKHESDRIIYDVYEEQYGDKQINPNFYMVLFDSSNELDGANLDSTMNLYDAIETLNFSITRYSVI